MGKSDRTNNISYHWSLFFLFSSAIFLLSSCSSLLWRWISLWRRSFSLLSSSALLLSSSPFSWSDFLFLWSVIFKWGMSNLLELYGSLYLQFFSISNSLELSWIVLIVLVTCYLNVWHWWNTTETCSFLRAKISHYIGNSGAIWSTWLQSFINWGNKMILFQIMMNVLELCGIQLWMLEFHSYILKMRRESLILHWMIPLLKDNKMNCPRFIIESSLHFYIYSNVNVNMNDDYLISIIV